VREVGVEVAGKGWLWGAAIGFVLDVTTVVLVAHAFDDGPLCGTAEQCGDWHLQ
jgi:hypothetical protein